MLVVVFGFVMHFINKNSVEKSLFELPDWQAAAQHSSFSTLGRVYIKFTTHHIYLNLS